MQYIISTIGKAKNSDEDIITNKYLKRIKKFTGINFKNNFFEYEKI